MLLDTRLLLWAAFAADRIPAATARRLVDPANTLWFSAASIWEVAQKRALNRPDFRVDPGVLRGGLLENDYRELAVEGRHCLILASLPQHDSDSIDRMLIAQAAAEGMVLLTADPRVAAYAGAVELI